MATEFTSQDWIALREDIGELKAAVKDVTKALERLARLEEKHANSREEIDRSFAEISKLDLRCVGIEQRVAVVEQALPSSRKTGEWVDKFVYGVFGLVAMFLLKKAGMV